MNAFTHIPAAVLTGCTALVSTCADLKAGERALIISDDETSAVGSLLAQAALGLTPTVTHLTIKALATHGAEPPTATAAAMLAADVIFGLTKRSMAHTKARLSATEQGVRYLSLPDYSVQLLESPALQTDFRAISPLAEKLASILTTAETVEVRTAIGTKLCLSVKGRSANPAPGWCWAPGTLASPPDAEVNIAPIEDETEGVVVVDGSIPCPEIGLVDEPLTLTIAKGMVTHIHGRQGNLLAELFDRTGTECARVVAELGFGLNPLAKLCGVMLEDEGCAGTIHFGMGSNATIGGKNNVPFHLDHVVRNATVTVDGQTIVDVGRLLVAVSS